MLDPEVLCSPAVEFSSMSEAARFRRIARELGYIKALVRKDPANAEEYAEDVKYRMTYE